VTNPKADAFTRRLAARVPSDGTPEAAKRIERVLTTDPGMGVVRHVDAGYDEAIEFARENGVKVPMWT
jgi:urocanate hydratase